MEKYNRSYNHQTYSHHARGGGNPGFGSGGSSGLYLNNTGKLTGIGLVGSAARDQQKFSSQPTGIKPVSITQAQSPINNQQNFFSNIQAPAVQNLKGQQSQHSVMQGYERSLGQNVPNVRSSVDSIANHHGLSQGSNKGKLHNQVYNSQQYQTIGAAQTTNYATVPVSSSPPPREVLPLVQTAPQEMVMKPGSPSNVDDAMVKVQHQALPSQQLRAGPQKGQYRAHSDTQHYDHFYKIILTGDAGVGKSNFLLRYVNNVFENRPSTIGVEFAYKVTYLKNKTKVKAQIWDTSGSEKYRSITTGHYRFALGAILVYDVTSAESFKNCRYWVDSIRCYADENVVIALVGNKCDVPTLAPQKRKVSTEEARKFAEENGLIFVGESSAQSNTNVQEVMSALFEEINNVQTDLVQKGLKRAEVLKVSEEEVMLNNHRCCY